MGKAASRFQRRRPIKGVAGLLDSPEWQSLNSASQPIKGGVLRKLELIDEASLPPMQVRDGLPCHFTRLFHPCQMNWPLELPHDVCRIVVGLLTPRVCLGPTSCSAVEFWCNVTHGGTDTMD